jgi:hypothetical protein
MWYPLFLFLLFTGYKELIRAIWAGNQVLLVTHSLTSHLLCANSYWLNGISQLKPHSVYTCTAVVPPGCGDDVDIASTIDQCRCVLPVL